MHDGTVIRAFGAEHVVKLTGLSYGQLRAWDLTGFFAPEYAYEDRRSPHSRIYSFRDVVGLRTVAVLRERYRVSLQELRRVAARLSELGYNHWADVKLYVVNRQVHFQPPGTDRIVGVWDGQQAMLPVIEVIEDVKNRVAFIQTRSKGQHGRIEQHRYVARNSPVIAGTRIPVAAIRRYKEAGYTIAQIIREYPTLSPKDVKAALSFKERVA
jgi:uncharacterized protein (DUF433 family)